MSGRKKLSYREIAEQHGAEIDQADPTPQKRARFRRMLDKIYERGLGDTLVAQKAAEEYCARVAGKPVTPVDVNSTVTHQTTEQHVESILETLAALKAKAKPSSERVN